MKNNIAKNKILSEEEEKKFYKESDKIEDYLDKKLNSINFSGSFDIEVRDYKNTELLKYLIDQMKEYKIIVKKYFDKLKNLFSKYGLLDEKGKYSYSERFEKRFEYNEVIYFETDKIIDYYEYLLTIQDYFYYDENKGYINFYSNTPKEIIDKFDFLGLERDKAGSDKENAREEYYSYREIFYKYSKY